MVILLDAQNEERKQGREGANERQLADLAGARRLPAYTAGLQVAEKSRLTGGKIGIVVAIVGQDAVLRLGRWIWDGRQTK